MTNRRRIRASANGAGAATFTLAIALVATPLLAIGGATWTLSSNHSEEHPRGTTIGTVPISDGDTVLVEDAAVGTKSIATDANPMRGVVKEIRRDEEFDMFALTWEGDPDSEAFFRAERPDGTWSEWYETHAHHPADDSTTGANGTELIFVEPTTAVQVSTDRLGIFTNAAGDLVDSANAIIDQAIADALGHATAGVEQAVSGLIEGHGSSGVRTPKTVNTGNVTAVFADTGVTAGDASGGVGGDFAGFGTDDQPLKNLTGMPEVVTREEWGADEDIRCRDSSDNGPIKATTVHHTAGSNNYSPEQAAGIMRGIYSYHAQTLGWCDVGYNALVDKYGTIYEGRHGGLDKGVQGAHAGGFNEDTWAVSMIGNYESVEPSQETIDSVGTLLGWRMSLDEVDPKGQTSLTAGAFSGSRFRSGEEVELPTIFGHRDVGNTECPGTAGYAKLDEIRDIAEQTYTAIEDGEPTDEATPPGGFLPTNSPTGDSGTGTLTVSPSFGSLDGEHRAGCNCAECTGRVRQTQNNDHSHHHDHDHTHGSFGNQSILAAVLGLTGAPGIGYTAEEILSVTDEPDRQFTIADIPVTSDSVVTIEQDTPFASTWLEVTESFGEILGAARSGIQNGATLPNDEGIADALKYVKFEHGIITGSQTIGTSALWGPVADAWADQGYEVGELGAPTKTMFNTGSLWTAEFQNGTITFDETTGDLTVVIG